MSIMDKIKGQLDELTEEGVDLSRTNSDYQIVANTVNPFPATFDGESCTGGALVNDIVLTEGSVHPQEKGGAGSGSNDIMSVLQLSAALPGGQIGIMDDGTFEAHPAFLDPDFSGVVSSSPLIFTQFMRANPDTVTELKELLYENGYIPRQTLQGNGVSKTADLEGERWALEAQNPQSGFRSDIRARLENGLRLTSLTVRPPAQVDPEREQFIDFLSAFHGNLQRVAKLVALAPKDNKDAQRAARRLSSSLTGAAPGKEGDAVFPLRASVPEFTVAIQVGPNRWTERTLSFWNSQENQVPA